MTLERLGLLADNPQPLSLRDVPVPVPRDGEVLIGVSCCGVCHTELDEIEGRSPPPVLPVIPGHQLVGTVASLGPSVRNLAVGDRVGVGWIHSSSGAEDENLSDQFRATGRDANGGYAEFVTVNERYAFPIPDVFSSQEAAPLLCAGAVGYRSLRLTGLRDGQALGLTGFGASAHIVIQLAAHMYPASPVYVFARSERERAFARQLGAHWTGDTRDAPPQLLHAIIDTTPAWQPVLSAMEALRPGGRLVINAIRKEDHDRSVMAGINYATHLWQEKELKSVANVTAADIRDCLAIAASIPLRVETELYALEQANEALRELRDGALRGAKVLDINSN